MNLSDVTYTIGGWVKIILVVGFAILFIFNWGDQKEDNKLCMAFYGDVGNKYPELMYWKENNLCCHYALSDDYRIVQECQ